MRQFINTATIIAALATLLACGPSPDTKGSNSGTDAEYQRAMLEWTRSMRANGVPDFPDPDANGRFLIPKSIDVTSEAFKRAVKASESKFPADSQTRSAQADAELLAQALEYARSMRAHGVPNFPDPEVVNGRVRMKMPVGVDPNSEAFRKAAAASKSKRPVGLGG